MRIRKPRRASLDDVKISRDGDAAVIEFADPSVSTTHFKIGPQVRQMSDQAILARATFTRCGTGPIFR